MLLFTGYNQFVLVPRMQAEQKAAEEALAKTQQELAMAESSVSVIKTQKTALPEELITFQTPVAQITFTSKGAGIKEYLFKDVLGDVNLTPYKGEGYFTTLPQVDFREAKRTQDAITFTADITSGVTVEKTYTFAQNGINRVNLYWLIKRKKKSPCLPLPLISAPDYLP